ncbi:MAG: hypothetical protein EOQ98_19295 [Mesorhizobium sp.]|uniref:hypothetical protein n=1 Tax=Mesorhizobium sp. TaxID=1871066 RepID=UPI000FE7766E|nr:hypothetical protein [Mesorhizobium sp.]RWO97180.1 MAG: hypothetical protein EOQ98_19295 [Mesorhizobium sp.]TIM52602.1 MAG: hypothetical protein E5Y69_00850 [Mesorhizobium sp.]
MPAREALLAAVAKLDMIELCGRIVSNPERNAPRATAAEVFALAKATEGLWAIALEASLLVSALERSMVLGVRAEQVALQVANLRDLLAFMPSPIPTSTGE